SDQSFVIQPLDPTPKTDVGQPRPASRVHPTLERLLAERNSAERHQLIINLRETLTVPRLPDLPPGERRDSALGKEMARQQQTIVDQLRLARQQSQASLIAGLQERHNARVLQQHWLVNAFLVELPL